jgi:hypothetical protein
MATEPKKIIIDTDPGIGKYLFINRFPIHFIYILIQSVSLLFDRWCYGYISCSEITRGWSYWTYNYLWKCLHYSCYQKCFAFGNCFSFDVTYFDGIFFFVLTLRDFGSEVSKVGQKNSFTQESNSGSSWSLTTYLWNWVLILNFHLWSWRLLEELIYQLLKDLMSH